MLFFIILAVCDSADGQARTSMEKLSGGPDLLKKIQVLAYLSLWPRQMLLTEVALVLLVHAG